MTKQVIKLSKDTLEIIKNASTINNSMRFSVGNSIKTINAAGNVIMEATIDETLPVEFSIYELNKFLSVLNLPNMKDAELVFEDDKKVTIQSGKSKIQYYFTDASFTTHPNKDINLPSVDLETEVEADTLEGFTKAASALGHKILAFRVQTGKALLVATTPDIDTSNDYVYELGDTTAADGEYKLKIENLKIIPGDYTIQICAKGLMKLVHKTRPLTFFLGLERQ